MRTREELRVELKNETEALKNVHKLNREQLRWIKWATREMERLTKRIVKLGGDVA